MKATTIIKISPSIELTTPVLLQCKSGECGGCPNNTGKLLWVPLALANFNTTPFNFKYDFFNKSAESTSEIKYNLVDGSTFINGEFPSYSNSPNKAWATANIAQTKSPSILAPSLMTGIQTVTSNFFISTNGTGGWLFFRQPNPAIANVHDALCFEYNHEKRLITFRSF